jgi:chromosome segregation protein
LATSLTGVLGTVAQLIRVPSKYEAALEVALGGHVQDLVVESWADAETAIAYLRTEKKGRATFLPLDTVRLPQRLDLPEEGGLEGIGADLVRAEERLRPVIEMLLGRTVVVQDLPSARQIFDRLRGNFQIVTLAGELLGSSGALTGGDSRKIGHGQVLGREREWRRLPGQIDSAEDVLDEHKQKMAGLHSLAEKMQAERTALAAGRLELEEALAAAVSQRAGLERETEHLAQQIDWRCSLVTRLDGEGDDLAAHEADLQSAAERLALERKTTDGEVAAVQAELDQLQGDVLYQRLSEARTEAAVALGAWDHRTAALEGLTDRKNQIRAQILAKRQRVDELQSDRESLSSQIESQSAQEAVIRGELDTIMGRIDAADAKVASLEEEREKLDREDTTLRARLREAESRHSQSSLVHSRQEDRLQRLREQIEDDFGLVEMEPTEGLPEQPPLPLGALVSALPNVDRLPEGLEDEIHQIKAQLKRMGSVNPNAPDEYAEVLDRYSFLTSQASDLEEAVSGLRQVIVELEEVMRHEFEAMFKEVALRFKENFTQLFDGGSARLLLTEPDDISRTGVEIIAQPPGRRRQTLALLSGGERSLTAVALIFALLQVSAPPFCVLDEVDAMLDEANVRRFRAALEDLAQRTQFIVITHNRRTIEAADTIYGISMGDDSVSQAVSLRLEGDRIAAPDGSSVDVAKDG